MRTYPELNAGTSPEQFTGRLTLTVRGGADFNLAYLSAALVAATDFHKFLELSPQPHPDAGELGDLYSFDALPDLDALAEAQGVRPIENIDDLVADFWPEDESVEDFIAAATEGRREEDEPDS